MKRKILLHTCCGPCASACVPRLQELGYEVVMYFSNSNIDTEEEFDKRLQAAQKLAANDGVEIAFEKYDHAEWLREVAAGFEREPEKGRRCDRCFYYNLKKAARYALREGIELFTSSLTVSPHKISPRVFSAGNQVAGESAVAFLEENFKKREGFKRSLIRSAQLGLYRQDYCGCEFSKNRVKIDANIPVTQQGVLDKKPQI